MISFYLIPMERSTLIMLLLLCMKCMAHRSRFVTRLQNRARPDQFVSGDNLLSQTKNINPTLIPQSLSVTARSDALRLASAAAAIFYLPTAAQAVKGAFELDAEYYLKALIGGDKKEQLLNRRSPLYVSPRKLDTTLANSVLECVLEAAQNLFGIRKEVILDAVSKSLPYSVKYFKLFAALGNEDVSDQYYFDMLLFLYYREIGQRIESSPDRVRLREKVGEEVLNLLLKERSVVINKLPLGPQSTTSPLSNGIERMLDLPVGTSQPVSAACANMPVFRASLKQILDKFTKSGLLSDYVFDDEDLGDVSYLASTFSEDLSLNFQITLQQPATILGFIEQYKQDTFFHPEIFGSTICALARKLGYSARFEDYLMDNYYRTENFDVQAQDLLLEFGLTL